MRLSATLQAELAKLGAQGLHGSAALLSGFLLSASPTSDHCRRLEVLVEQAWALLELREYSRAEAKFDEALLLRKATIKETFEFSPRCDIDNIRFGLAKTYSAQRRIPRAIQTLTAMKVRPPAAQMMLGELLAETGNQQQAVACYKEVLRECPLALEAIRALAAAGHLDEVSIALASVPGTTHEDLAWLYTWAEAQRASAAKDYPQSVQLLKQLEKNSLQRDPEILSQLGESQWRMGHLPAARSSFALARNNDPHLISRMDVYAHVLVANGRNVDMNRLCQDLLSRGKDRIEAWVSMARFCQLLCENETDPGATRQHARRGLGFIEKASEMSSNNVEMLMVKGTLLLALDRQEDATLAFRQAYVQSYDFAAYQGLVSCMLVAGRLKEALLLAKEGQQKMPQNARMLTLLGLVCKRFADGAQKARRAFEQALRFDPNCMDAVVALSDHHVDEQDFDKAIKLLQDHISNSRTDYMHNRLGEVHLMAGNAEQARIHFSQALRDNPHYQPALDGLADAVRELNGAAEGEEDEEEGELEDGEGEQEEEDDANSSW